MNSKKNLKYESKSFHSCLYDAVNASSRGKNELSYLWSDYKWLLLAGVVVLAILGGYLIAAFTEKETAVAVMLIDCHAEVSEGNMEKDVSEALGLDDRKQQAQIQTQFMFSDSDSANYTMTSLSRFLADIGSEKLDVCGMLEDDFLKYDNSETWLDLKNLLPAEFLSGLRDGLLEKDGRVIGIYADAFPLMEAYGCYEDPATKGVLGVIYNAPHKEAAKDYLLFSAGQLQD